MCLINTGNTVAFLNTQFSFVAMLKLNHTKRCILVIIRELNLVGASDRVVDRVALRLDSTISKLLNETLGGCNCMFVNLDGIIFV